MKSDVCRRRKRVIAAIALNVYSGQRKLSGMIDFFNTHLTCEDLKWDLDVVCGYEQLTPTVLSRYVKDGVDGFLLLCHPSAEAMRFFSRTGLPCVIETSSEMPFEGASNIVRVLCDTRELARAAAQHFVSRQVFKGFGFVNTHESEQWSTERGRFFAEAVAERGRKVLFTSLGDNLTRWLRRLPRPAAVCAANDATARLVAAEAKAAGMLIPDDLAILGFDDDPVFCLRPEPRLSSVAQDFARCGFLAAETLDLLMRGETGGPRTLTYGARDVVIRESTMRDSPHVGLVQKALSFIDANGCGNVGADDVAEHLGVSRRLIDLRFSEILGHSIYEILRERKLDEVKRLLRTTDESISSITDASGFTNKTHLKNLFRRCTGLSMREWRAANKG